MVKIRFHSILGTPSAVLWRKHWLTSSDGTNPPRTYGVGEPLVVSDLFSLRYRHSRVDFVVYLFENTRPEKTVQEKVLVYGRKREP